MGIYISSAATTTPSSIQGNTIAGINLSGVVGGTSTTAAFVGISIASGVANIGNVTGNTVGSLTTAGAVSVTSNNASAMEVFGIYYFPSAVANVSNNTVGGITATNSGAGSLVFYGIRAFTSSTVTNTMQNNTIGSTAAPITNTSSSASSRTIGLYCQSGACVATGNTVSNLSMNGGNVGTGSSAAVIGLWIDDSSATIGNNIAQNTIYALSNSNASAAVWVTGLQYNGATTGTHLVQRNFIYNLSTPSTSATATVNGINVQGGLTTYQNNMIDLGNDMTANSPQINGINETIAGTDNFYFNSVYIGGSGVAAGTANSFAFNSAITLNTRNYRDNIFFNARSNGAATGKHYAIQVGGTAPNPGGLTTNNNVLYATGTGGFTGRFNALDQATLANWQAATGQDANSFSSDPQFVAPTAATPDLHINPSIVTVVEGNGFLIASVTDDYDGQIRASPDADRHRRRRRQLPRRRSDAPGHHLHAAGQHRLDRQSRPGRHDHRRHRRADRRCTAAAHLLQEGRRQLVLLARLLGQRQRHQRHLELHHRGRRHGRRDPWRCDLLLRHRPGHGHHSEYRLQPCWRCSDRCQHRDDATGRAEHLHDCGGVQRRV